jgi:hypothetical protein
VVLLRAVLFRRVEVLFLAVLFLPSFRFAFATIRL